MGVVDIIVCKIIVTVTPITKNAFILNIDFPLIRKAIPMWDITNALNTIVLARVSDPPRFNVVLKTKRRIKVRRAPVVAIKMRRWLLSIGEWGSRGLRFNMSGSFLSLAKAKAGMPSVTKLIQRICVGSRGAGKPSRLARKTSPISERLPDKR